MNGAKMGNTESCEKVAVLVDGAFYRRRASALFGAKSPEARAKELVDYCKRHLRGTTGNENNSLYRIFYYDCPPMRDSLFHPLTGKNICMRKTPLCKWSTDFLDALAAKRKLAIRLGELQERESAFRIKQSTVKKLCKGEISFADVTESDFEPDFVQKGVDMRIGLDIASLAYKKQVSQIVLIAGDCDFVPAAKHARREGIDFILDPMWQSIRPSLQEHIDGLHSCVNRDPSPETEPLHADYRKSKKQSGKR